MDTENKRMVLQAAIDLMTRLKWSAEMSVQTALWMYREIGKTKDEKVVTGITEVEILEGVLAKTLPREEALKMLGISERTLRRKLQKIRG